MRSRKLTKIFINTILVIIGLAIIFTVNGYYEKVIINSQIDSFKDRAEYIGEDPYRENVHYYKVPKKYDYEDTSRNTFDVNTRIVGSKTDVIITNRNPMRGVDILDPMVGFLANNFFVGHSSMNTTDDGKRMIEVIGNSGTPENNTVVETYNDWISTEDRLGSKSVSPIIIGMRIKDTTEEQRDKMVEYAYDQIGKGYNYTFIFNRANTFYCTDLVSRAAKHAGLHINYDHFSTTGNDMIISKNTYIFFLRETVIVNGEKIFNVYYLDNE